MDIRASYAREENDRELWSLHERVMERVTDRRYRQIGLSPSPSIPNSSPDASFADGRL